MAPARLDHSNLGIAEIVDDIIEKIRRRDEIRIEDRDQLARGEFQPVLQCACLEAVTVRTMDVMNVVSKLLIIRYAGGGDSDGAQSMKFVGVDKANAQDLLNEAVRLPSCSLYPVPRWVSST